MLLGCDVWMRCSKLGQCHKCRLTVVRFADAVFMLSVTCFVAMWRVDVVFTISVTSFVVVWRVDVVFTISVTRFVVVWRVDAVFTILVMYFLWCDECLWYLAHVCCDDVTSECGAYDNYLWHVLLSYDVCVCVHAIFWYVLLLCKVWVWCSWYCDMCYCGVTLVWHDICDICYLVLCVDIVFMISVTCAIVV